MSNAKIYDLAKMSNEELINIGKIPINEQLIVEVIDVAFDMEVERARDFVRFAETQDPYNLSDIVVSLIGYCIDNIVGDYGYCSHTEWDKYCCCGEDDENVSMVMREWFQKMILDGDK